MYHAVYIILNILSPKSPNLSLAKYIDKLHGAPHHKQNNVITKFYKAYM